MSCSWLCLVALSLPVIAADPLEEILVTADFRDTDLMETGASISVLGEPLIFARGAQHLEEILGTAPNVNFASGSSRARYFQIRGVGDRSQFQEPLNASVGVLLDGVDFSGIGSLGTTFDVDQVEILRGPQGTLHGANALAGLISISSNAPTDEPHYYLEATGGNYGAYGLGGVSSGPITEDVLYRIALQQFNSDGYQDNDFTGDSDTADRDEFTGRARLRWLANDRHTLDLGITFIDMDNGYDAFSLDNTRTTLSDQPGKDIQESLAGSLATSSDFTVGSLQTRFSVAHTDVTYAYDEDWTFVGFHPDAYSSYDQYERKRDSLSAELRFLSNARSRLFNERSDWVVGLYHLSNEEDLDRTYTFAPFFQSENDTDTYAVFGQIDTALTDVLTLITGLRWEKRDTDYSDNNRVDFSPDDDMWGGRIALEYQWNDATLMYGSVSRGYRAQGVNGGILANIQATVDPAVVIELESVSTFDEETLINYELGLKSRLLDNRLQARIALFYMDRDDQQVRGSLLIPQEGGATTFIDYTSNAAEGENYGAEIEVDWRAADQLMLWANIGLLETEFDEYVNVFQEDLSGREQAQAPRYQYSVGGRYDLPMDLFLRLEVEGRDSFYFSDRHNEKSDAYDLLSASLGWEHEAWRVVLWGRNLTDEDYYVRGFGSFANDPRNGYIVEPYYQFGEPRVYGLTAAYTF
ncbi:MAG: TonB-dependent receptor [Halioglobus sp.]|nr:TonB-dependent receptor [Halioglobus sp.]